MIGFRPLSRREHIPDDQKRELIETLWSIVVAFVDFGFGIHPVQQNCGEEAILDAALLRDVLGSEDRLSDRFNTTAGPQEKRVSCDPERSRSHAP